MTSLDDFLDLVFSQDFRKRYIRLCMSDDAFRPRYQRFSDACDRLESLYKSLQALNDHQHVFRTVKYSDDIIFKCFYRAFEDIYTWRGQVPAELYCG